MTPVCVRAAVLDFMRRSAGPAGHHAAAVVPFSRISVVCREPVGTLSETSTPSPASSLAMVPPAGRAR